MELTETTPAMAALRAALADAVEEWKPRVQAMAHEIHGNKEVSFEEVRSAEAAAAASRWNAAPAAFPRPSPRARAAAK
jgi:hypothetical protein